MQLKPYTLPEKCIHIWHCQLTQNEAQIKRYYSLLSLDEKERSSRFKFNKDRSCYIVARGVLRLLLGRYLKMNPTDIVFEYSAYQKPYVSPESDLKFNLSHSGNSIVFAFCKNHAVGVDIEKIKEDINALELAQNFFSKTEIKALKKQPKASLQRAFFRCWTRKESFIKAEGSGLSFPLDQFAVSLDDDHTAALLETRWKSSEKDAWSLFSFVPRLNYLAAVSVRDKQTEVEFYDWDDAP